MDYMLSSMLNWSVLGSCISLLIVVGNMGKEGISYANRHVQRGLETFGSTLLRTIFEEFKINTDIELSNDMQPNLSGGSDAGWVSGEIYYLHPICTSNSAL